MSLKRDQWKRIIKADEFPCSWSCYSCGYSLQKGSVNKEKETTSSEMAKSHDDWDPNWYDGRIFGILKCVNPKCGEEISYCGKSSLDWDYDENGMITEKFFHPTFFHPPLPLFQIDKTVPEEIKTEIDKSFSLYWADSPACANKIRNTIEAILNHFRIPKTTTTAKGKTQKLTLHHRILKYQAKDAEIADLMLAIKWIGNTGSHLDSLTEEDLLDGYELLSGILENLFEKKTQKLLRTARGINKTKKPRSKSRKR